MGSRWGVNGFGRIGRNLFRAAHEAGSELEFVAVNDITDAATLAHLLKFGSTYGRFPGRSRCAEGAIAVDGVEIKVLGERIRPPSPRADLGVEVVIESTGLFPGARTPHQAPGGGGAEGDHLGARDGADVMSCSA